MDAKQADIGVTQDVAFRQWDKLRLQGGIFSFIRANFSPIGRRFVSHPSNDLTADVRRSN
jgi:hypothetical protein